LESFDLEDIIAGLTGVGIYFKKNPYKIKKIKKNKKSKLKIFNLKITQRFLFFHLELKKTARQFNFYSSLKYL
jgi:hypothetical protein